MRAAGFSAAAAVVLAAGASSRFGSQKLLADLDGEPMLNRTIRALLDGGVGLVVVVLPSAETPEKPRASPAPATAAIDVPLFADPRVRIATNHDRSRGMFSSIQAGCAAAGDADPLLILPGDMPFVRAQTVTAVAAGAGRTGRIVSPRFGGKRGHPIALPRSLRNEILKSSVETSLHDLLERHESERVYVDVDDPGVLRDVDVPEDLTGAPGRAHRS